MLPRTGFRGSSTYTHLSLRTLFSFMTLGVMFGACGDRKKSPKQVTDSKKVYFIHGDPMSLIAEANRLQEAFPLTILSGLEDAHLSLAHAFLAKSEEKSGEFAQEVKKNAGSLTRWASQFLKPQTPFDSFYQLEESNETKFDPSVNQLRSYRFRLSREKVKRKASSGNLYLYEPETKKEGDVAFSFELTKGGLRLVDALIVSKNSNYLTAVVEPIHHSQKNDGTAMSLLFKEVSSGNLFHFVFTRNEASSGTLRFAELDRKFTYLFGEGVAAKWKNDPKIHLCSKRALDRKWERVESAIESWQQVFPRLNMEHLDSYPPFSDLNITCLYLSSDYVLSEKQFGSRIAGTLGVTIPSVDFVKKEILSAPIFLFLPTIKKLSQDYFAQVQATAVHELGHFLGLGHEFRKNLDGSSKYKSVMGYDPAISKVTEHDQQAVFTLYDGKNQD